MTRDRPPRLTGRVYEGSRAESGRMIYRDVNAEESNRPPDWRNQQSRKSLLDVLKGR